MLESLNETTVGCFNGAATGERTWLRRSLLIVVQDLMANRKEVLITKRQTVTTCGLLREIYAGDSCDQ